MGWVGEFLGVGKGWILLRYIEYMYYNIKEKNNDINYEEVS